MTAGQSRVLLRIEGLTKSFGATRALDGVGLTIHAGEVLAVVGHNGSGKSTLVKIMAGFHTADSGTIDPHGEPGPPTELRFIHQDLGLVETMSTLENLGLGGGRDRAPWLPLRRAAERRVARELTARFGIDIDVDAEVRELSPAERTIVAIARALRGWHQDQNMLLVLDEPTAALHGAEVDRLMAVVRRVAERGAGVLFISHRLDEVLGVADTVLALRNGRIVGNLPRAEVDYAGLVELVAGGSLDALGRRDTGHGKPVLRVRGLAGRSIVDLDVTVHAGEIVGVAGILGSGRDEVCATIFGGRRRSAGTVELADHPLDPGDLREAVRRGAAFVPGDRHQDGAVMTMTATENLMTVRVPGAESRWSRLRKGHEAREAATWFSTCGVVPAVPTMELSRFSGGNQQKVVLAKWLRTRPRLLLLEEPTQGVDVGAKSVIHQLIAETAAAGTGVLVASSEAKELAELCDRVLVLDDGVVGEELAGDELTEARILTASVRA
ncbi:MULTISPECIES: sugar ABC transporter ATP-binding protein [Actinomadura]|uniref:Monosaccharide ABC transporter ATP-binding protein, CUT2 family n=1 Tax=Actinomadura madurae TaxID=1993 RepID=A0A1I4ZWE5_9ACTN|nr:sugar ABC transporter ATP-binding protein [Actinomadura madurae]SFN54360.1 monosaccharide ABC transporter ATP-binding protein, CUT2 family [Actinomadura madurae]